MFTGIVEELGEIKSIKKSTHSCQFEIEANLILRDLKIGDSICVNGICLTVTEFSNTSFKADIMHETLNRSALSKLKIGQKINLERAMPMNGRFGGHIVSGHVDGVGKIIEKYKDDTALWFRISTSENILKYIILKGSITIDGISLTVADLDQVSFKVSCIPHTIKSTSLNFKILGDEVNLENDLIGKYIEKFLNFKSENKSKITREFLSLNGY
ncbi:MAG: riboflavin synthase [Peptoniphilaceae bacterium]